MSKIDEIAKKHLIVCDFNGSPNTIDGFYEYFESAMIEYAEWYAQKCIKKVAEIAEIMSTEQALVDYRYRFNRDRLTKIDLPSHDDEA